MRHREAPSKWTIEMRIRLHCRHGTGLYMLMWKSKRTCSHTHIDTHVQHIRTHTNRRQRDRETERERARERERERHTRERQRERETKHDTDPDMRVEASRHDTDTRHRHKTQTAGRELFSQTPQASLIQAQQHVHTQAHDDKSGETGKSGHPFQTQTGGRCMHIRAQQHHVHVCMCKSIVHTFVSRSPCAQADMRNDMNACVHIHQTMFRSLVRIRPRLPHCTRSISGAFVTPPASPLAATSPSRITHTLPHTSIHMYAQSVCKVGYGGPHRVSRVEGETRAHDV